MKRCYRLKFTVTYLIALLCCFELFAQTNKFLLTDNKLKNKLDSVIDNAAEVYLQDSNTNGISIGVYSKGGKYSYNYGKADKGKLASANNFYNIGSVAKTFVTTILAQAVVDKKLNLNDDIRSFYQINIPI